jgi:hypothetical protein
VSSPSDPFDLLAMLDRGSAGIVDEAATALDRSHLPHYEGLAAEERVRRLRSLFDVVRLSLQTRDLVPIHDYAEHLARERFDAGFDIAEVLTAFNVLEEELWRRTVAEAAPAQLADAIGMVSTVLGAGKSSLACAYVALASRGRVPSLDLTALFRGTA